MGKLIAFEFSGCFFTAVTFYNQKEWDPLTVLCLKNIGCSKAEYLESGVYSRIIWEHEWKRRGAQSLVAFSFGLWGKVPSNLRMCAVAHNKKSFHAVTF